MQPTVVVVGAKELRHEIRNAGDDGLKKELAAANKSAAELVADKARPNVPVLTGRLLGSVRGLGSQTSGRAVAGKAAVPYAAAIHWGRKTGGHIVGRPFLWDAAQRHTEQVTAEYQEAIERLLEQL